MSDPEKKLDRGESRQAIVRVPLAIVAEALFGPGVEIDGIFRTPHDDSQMMVSIVVSGHASLPQVAPGEGLSHLEPHITEHIHGVRTTEFRAFVRKSH